MSNPSELDLLVLLGLRLRSFADATTVANSVGLAPEPVITRLDAFGAAGLARFRDGRSSGWMLTSPGRLEGERLLAAELDGRGVRPAVVAAYQRFLGVNQQMLDTCTDWQLRTVEGVQVVNDHTDPTHDAAVVARLGGLDDAVQPVAADLAEQLERFGGYGPRLAGARAKVQGGDPDWFTKPTIDSYHTVWFELHENLLATLGVERGRELTGPAEPTTPGDATARGEASGGEVSA